MLFVQVSSAFINLRVGEKNVFAIVINQTIDRRKGFTLRSSEESLLFLGNALIHSSDIYSAVFITLGVKQ